MDNHILSRKALRALRDLPQPASAYQWAERANIFEIGIDEFARARKILLDADLIRRRIIDEIPCYSVNDAAPAAPMLHVVETPRKKTLEDGLYTLHAFLRTLAGENEGSPLAQRIDNFLANFTLDGVEIRQD